MALEPVVTVYDACVLYPFHLRNIIVQAAVDRLVAARWTDRIHDEWTRNLVANASTTPAERLQATRELMDAALPGALVSGYEAHIESVTLPDPDDRHVIAAAIAAGASAIVTWNLRDFPAAELRNHGLKARSPDRFLSDLYDQAPELLVGSMANARRNLTVSRVSASGFLELLRGQKLDGLAKRIEKHLNDL